ncbi:MAG: rRNA maturation RNase YbeY [Chloroflexi bacterium]|nr:rRNA maturation RNase YbeY [Chloroflexota bacterium]MYD47188.1 rRNA maturation RNase YbeY [Chloroflexota bacterium]
MDVPLPGIAVSVQTDLPDGAVKVPCPQWLVAAVRCGLAQVLAPDAIGQVSLLLTGDATVQELNRQYRGLDETTDVLSFSAEYAGHWEGDNSSPSPQPSPIEREGEIAAAFPIPTDEPPPLGDIVISIPEAARQAEEQDISLHRELALLIAHGALHLLGHDHYGDGERAEMQRLERAALAAIFREAEG